MRVANESSYEKIEKMVHEINIDTGKGILTIDQVKCPVCGEDCVIYDYDQFGIWVYCVDCNIDFSIDVYTMLKKNEFSKDVFEK